MPEIYGRRFRKLEDPRHDKIFFEEASQVIEEEKTLLYYDRLFTLYEVLKDLLLKHPLITVVESGAYRGGTSHFLASTSERLGLGKISALYSIDTFQGNSAKDLTPGTSEGTHFVSEFGGVDFQEISRYLSRFPFIHILKGRVQDVAPDLAHLKFQLVHLDMDIYRPTIFALNFFGERMIKGGVIILDDYRSSKCPGIKKSVEEYCESHREVTRIPLLQGQCILVF